MDHSARSRMAGFTLIELAVTMAVFAILAAAAMPAYREFFERYRLRGAVDDITSVIATARAGAVKADRDVRVSFGGSTSNWCVGAAAAAEPTDGAPAGGAVACDCVTNNPQCVVGGSLVRVEPGKHAGVTIGSVATTFEFDSKLGVVQPLGSACTSLKSPNQQYTMQINVNALGQTTTCSTGSNLIAGVTSCAAMGVAACP